MFGSIGGTELLVLVVIGLLVFGPKRLPELGRSLGKTLVELRRAAGEMKSAIEKEADLGEVRKTTQEIKAVIQREASRVFSDLEAEARIVREAQAGTPAAASLPAAAPAAPATQTGSAEAAKGEPGGIADA